MPNILAGGRSGLYDSPHYKIQQFVYFHGDIQFKLGYDIAYVFYQDKDDIQEIMEHGVGPIRVKNPDDRITDCMGFFWEVEPGIRRGLVVDSTDYEAIRFAVKCKNEERKFL